jgi:hypothetical protein
METGILSLGVKQMGHEVDHLPPYTGKLLIAWTGKHYFFLYSEMMTKFAFHSVLNKPLQLKWQC